MRFFRQGWLLLGFFLFASVPPAMAKKGPHSGSLREKRWPSSKGLCGIVRFALENFEYESVASSSSPGLARGTSMAGVVETSDPSCLKDYAIVQYIRGCIYNVRYRRAENRITDRYFGLVREQRGKTIPFVYPDWDIDTVDADPIYQSASGEHASHRLNHYRYAKVPLRMKNDPASIRADEKTVFNAKNYGFLSEEDVTPSQYFVTDLPTLADWVPNAGNGEEEWLNTSLEFDTCVYRTKDVPTSGLPAARGTPKESGGPLACLSWSHKQTFDPAKRMYQPHSGIDPACSEIASRVSSRRRDTQE